MRFASMRTCEYLSSILRLTCPAIAIEIAPEFSASHAKGASADDAGYQARVADAIAAALLEWRTEANQP